MRLGGRLSRVSLKGFYAAAAVCGCFIVTIGYKRKEKTSRLAGGTIFISKTSSDILLANPKRTKKILEDGETRIINAPSASAFCNVFAKDVAP